MPLAALVNLVLVFGIFQCMVSLMKKWILRVAIALVVLVAASFFHAKSYFTRDYLVSVLEKSINSRVQIKDMDISFSGFGGKVTLNDVIISKRDSLADEKVPHDERETIDGGDIIINSATFDVSIGEILSKKINLEEIRFDGATLNVTLYENGGTNLESLFAKPNKKEKDDTFNAKENKKFITTIEEIICKDVAVNLIVEKTQLRVEGRDIYVDLLDINVNPDKLDSVNDATIKMGGMFDLLSMDRTLEFGKVVTSGESNFTLFNAENGDLAPDMVVALTVDSDSYLTDKVPALSKIGKSAGLLTRFGVKALKLPEKAKFKNDQSVKVAYKNGISTLLEPLTIKVKDWELEAVAQSWLGTGNGLHKLGVKLLVGEAISKKINSVLGGKAGRLLGKFAGDTGLGSLLEDGKLTLHVESSGELSKPKVRIKSPLAKPSAELIDGLLGDDEEGDSLKKAGKNLLKGFLK